MKNTSQTTADRSKKTLTAVCAATCPGFTVDRIAMVAMQPKVRNLMALANRGGVPSDRELVTAMVNFGWMVDDLMVPAAGANGRHRQGQILKGYRKAFEIVRAKVAQTS